MKGLEILRNMLVLVIFTSLFANLDALNYPTPPVLKSNLHSLEDLEQYLKQLQTYYTVFGRPRLELILYLLPIYRHIIDYT